LRQTLKASDRRFSEYIPSKPLIAFAEFNPLYVPHVTPFGFHKMERWHGRAPYPPALFKRWGENYS
jgi:hypothetical protein